MKKFKVSFGMAHNPTHCGPILAESIFEAIQKAMEKNDISATSHWGLNLERFSVVEVPMNSDVLVREIFHS